MQRAMFCFTYFDLSSLFKLSLIYNIYLTTCDAIVRIDMRWFEVYKIVSTNNADTVVIWNKITYMYLIKINFYFSIYKRSHFCRIIINNTKLSPTCMVRFSVDLIHDKTLACITKTTCSSFIKSLSSKSNEALSTNADWLKVQ